jgi:hypothetical protein
LGQTEETDWGSFQKVSLILVKRIVLASVRRLWRSLLEGGGSIETETNISKLFAQTTLSGQRSPFQTLYSTITKLDMLGSGITVTKSRVCCRIAVGVYPVLMGQ